MLVAPIVGGWLTDLNPFLPFAVSVRRIFSANIGN
jgi:hypothetical protein